MITEIILVLRRATLSYLEEKHHGVCSMLTMAQKKVYTHKANRAKYL